VFIVKTAVAVVGVGVGVGVGVQHSVMLQPWVVHRVVAAAVL